MAEPEVGQIADTRQYPRYSLPVSFALSLAADVVEVEAGATTPLGLTIINQGSATDRFEVEIEGIDMEWRFIPVPTFTVEPGETRSEKAFLKPPRLPESVAGAYPFIVRVRSLESGETKTAQALLKLQAFHHLTMEIAPKKGVISPTTKRNDFRLTLVNLGNSEHTLQLSAQDPDDRCAYEFENDQIVLGPGQQREVEVIADPKQKPLLSSGRLIGFSVIARSLNERNVSATTQAQLEQRSLLSPATLAVAFLFIAAIAGWWAMRPKNPSISLSVSTPRALRGSTIQLRYIAQNADHVKITKGKDGTLVYEGPPTLDPVSTVVDEEGPGIAFVAEASHEGHDLVSDTKTVAIDDPVTAPLAEINELKTSAKRVKLGTSFVINWKVTGATKVAIVPGGGDDLSPDLEQQQITPSVAGTVTYSLLAYNADNKSVRKSVTVEVYDESDAVILLFSADPTSTKEVDGGKTTLTWKTTGAELVELKVGDNSPKPVDADGSSDFTIGAKTTFTLIATDAKKRKTLAKVTVDYEKNDIVVNPTTAGGTSTDPPIPDKIPPPR